MNNTLRSNKAALSLMALAAVSMPYTARAQLVRGTIVGTVTDAAGSRVAGEKIHITNQSTGLSQDPATNDSGSYTSGLLEAGHYKVEVSKDGFSTLVSGDIVLDPAAHVTQDAALTVGATTETVTVSALPLALNTTNATIGNTIDTTRLATLAGKWTQCAGAGHTGAGGCV